MLLGPARWGDNEVPPELALATRGVRHRAAEGGGVVVMVEGMDVSGRRRESGG